MFKYTRTAEITEVLRRQSGVARIPGVVEITFRNFSHRSWPPSVRWEQYCLSRNQWNFPRLTSDGGAHRQGLGVQCVYRSRAGAFELRAYFDEVQSRFLVFLISSYLIEFSGNWENAYFQMKIDTATRLHFCLVTPIGTEGTEAIIQRLTWPTTAVSLLPCLHLAVAVQ